jgi:hypothetical protein
MSSSTLELVLFAFAALSIGTLLIVLIWASRREKKAWSAFALKHGLTASDGPHVYGVYEGWALAITTDSRDSSQQTLPVTVFWLHLDGILPRDFSLLPTYEMRLPHHKTPGLGFWPLERLGPELRSQLSGATHQELERLASSYGSVSIQEGALTAKMVGIPKSVAQMESSLAPLVAIARLLDEVTGGTRVHRALQPPKVSDDP